jgi:hypothetical protein
MPVTARFGRDAVAVIGLAVLAFAAGRSAFTAAPSQPFSQAAFGPAVMVAAGKGFVNPVPAPGGALQRFLLMQSDSIDVQAIDVIRVEDPDQFQNMHRYLIGSVGAWWRVSQVSWQRLAEVAGVLHALAVLAVFVLLRGFLPVMPAVIGAAWLACSPVQLMYAPHLRDFAKGAFILAAIPGVVVLVLSASSRRAIAAVAAATGVVIGVGIGFRTDVAIMVPIAVVSLLLFRGARPWTGLGDKLLATGVLVLAVVVSAWPVLSRLSSDGSNAGHVVLLGRAEVFDARLGVEPAPYGYLPFYSDTYLYNVLRVRHAAATGVTLTMPSPEYDAASVELWQQWLRHFPADAHTRLLAAADGVLNLAFDNPTPEAAGNWPVTVALDGVWEWLNQWRGWGWLLGLALIGAAARRGLRRALFAALMLIALAGYPSLQYDPRHYFHLQAIPIVVIVAMAWAVVEQAAARLRGRQAAGDDRSPAVSLQWSALTAVMVALAVTVLPATTLRAYQAHHLRGTFDGFLHAERVPLDVEFVPVGTNRWLARWPGVKGVETRVPGLASAYYVAEFTADGSNAAMAIGLRYSFAPAWVPCALVRRLTTSAGVARFAFAAYSLEGDSSFDGIEMGPEMRRRLIGVHRVAVGPGGLPIEVRLAADWDRRRLSQRLVNEERVSPDDVGFALMGPADRCGSQIPFIDASLDPRWAAGSERLEGGVARIVHVSAGGLGVAGAADREAPVLATFEPVLMAAGDAVVARLWVDQGGVAIRLVRDGVLLHEVVVPRPGLSVVVIPVAELGHYAPQVASAAPGWRRALRFNLDRIGVVRADGRVAPGEARP